MENKVCLDIILIVLALENNNLYVLSRQSDNINLTKKYLDDNTNSFDIVEQILQESMGITGRWQEAQPKLLGIIDNVDRKTEGNNRLVSVVYTLCLPMLNSLKQGYEWIDMNCIDKFNNNEEVDIVRYASTNI